MRNCKVFEPVVCCVLCVVQDPAAREALLADVKKYVEEAAAVTKEHVTVSNPAHEGGGGLGQTCWFRQQGRDDR